MAITGWFPGLITWLFNNSSDPGMQNLRRNMDQGLILAQELLDSKRQELKDGMAKKDVMSLLGLSLLRSPLIAWSLITFPRQLNLVILSARTGD